MGALVEKYAVIGIQYNNLEGEISDAATKRNLKRMKDYWEWAYEQFSYAFPVKMIAYPEYATNGYPAGSMQEALKASQKVGDSITQEVGSWCKEYDCFVSFGMGESLDQYPKSSFDTAVIMNDQAGVELVYRKTNPWLPDEYWPSPHDFKDTWDFEKNPLYPVAKTTIGNWGAYICNDGMTPENCRQLAFNGAECMFHPELLMDPWDHSAAGVLRAADPLELRRERVLPQRRELRLGSCRVPALRHAGRLHADRLRRPSAVLLPEGRCRSLLLHLVQHPRRARVSHHHAHAQRPELLQGRQLRLLPPPDHVSVPPANRRRSRMGYV